MIYLLALLPATALTIAGYFVLVLSLRAEGALRTFGKYLGVWAFTLAGLVILGALFAAAHGAHRGGMHGMRGGPHCPWESGPRLPPPERASPGASQPAIPAPPPPPPAPQQP